MENVVESKVIVGASGSGKSVKAIREAWEDAKDGKNVVFAYTQGFSGDLLKLIKFAVGAEFDDLIESSSPRFVKVSKDVTSVDIEAINDQFEHYLVDVIYIDGADEAISDEFFEGLEKIVYVKQRIESGDGFAGLVTEEPTAEDRIGR